MRRRADDLPCGGELTTFLYYWDSRDGVGWQRWWIGAEVGSQEFMAFSPGDVDSPVNACRWRGHQPIGVRVRSLGDGLMGVHAAGLGFEGVYEVEADHPHRHSSRPVYRRARDLSIDEIANIDSSCGHAGSDVVIYHHDEPLTQACARVQRPPVVAMPSTSTTVVADAIVTDATQTEPAITDASIATGTALGWVNGDDLPAVIGVLGVLADGPTHSDVAPTEGQESLSEAHPLMPVLVRSLSVHSRADLETLVTKRSEERLSIPELADDESPLPMGWVLAERSTSALTT